MIFFRFQKSIYFVTSRSANSNSEVIFVFLEVDLHNRIFFSTQNSDLEFSASITARPKLQRPGGWPRVDLETCNLACNLRVGPNSYGIANKAEIQEIEN